MVWEVFCSSHDGGRGAGKEAFLEIAGQKSLVLQVPNRLSLSVQNVLYALDDLFAQGRAFRLEPVSSPSNSPWPSNSKIALYTQVRVDLDEAELEQDAALEPEDL